MDDTRTRQILVAVGVLIGLPLFLALWQSQFDRYGHGPAGAHITRGQKALAHGHYLEAISAFGHARELRPTDADVQLDLMRARAALVAEQPMRITGENAEEIRYEASYLLETDRTRSALYLAVLGNVAARAGNAEEARAKFDAALKADPSSLVAHAANAVFLLNQKDGAEKAKTEFEAVLKVKPDHVVALVGLAQLALTDGKADVAAERLEAALKVGDDFTARLLLGNARLRQQKPEEAVKEFQRATQLDPKNAEAWRSLGQALLTTNKPDEAERALRVSAQLQQDAQTVVALGFALNRQKKSDQALGMFQAVLQQNSGDAPAIFGAGNALEDLGKKQEAVTLYKKLMAMQAPQGAGGDKFLAQLQQEAQQRVNVIEGKPASPSGPSGFAPSPGAPGVGMSGPH